MFRGFAITLGMGQIRVEKPRQHFNPWQRTIGLSCKAGAGPRTRRVLDKTKRVVGSMVKLKHVQNMNRPLTSVQNMFSICPKRYGMNVPILVYHCLTNLAQNRFIFMAQSNIQSKIYIFCVFSGPDLTHILFTHEEEIVFGIFAEACIPSLEGSCKCLSLTLIIPLTSLSSEIRHAILR